MKYILVLLSIIIRNIVEEGVEERKTILKRSSLVTFGLCLCVCVCLQMSISGRLDQHLFHVLEVQNNSAAYLEKRKNVIEVQSLNWTGVQEHL